MLIYALALFAVAAVIGIVMASKHFGGANPPLPMALLHGLFAASGLVILILNLLQGGDVSLPSLVLFVVAALGGFVLFSFHLRQKRLPSPVVIIHAVVAVIAFLVLGFSLVPVIY
ncbi:MAG: hypothetical protein HZB64_05120 [Rhodocyclales bacterium]|nr:hypothetical protein [Rhodocyclales bacterium]